MNTPVSFELAKLLKEKGWNTYTSSFWKNPNGTPSLHIGVLNYNNRTKEDGSDLPAYSAPTIAEVVMWLYEKHGVWVQPMLYRRNPNDFIGAIYYSKNDRYFTQPYNSPAESQEAAIEYCLKNLI